MAGDQAIAPPSPIWLALEGRAWLEYVALVPAMPLLRRAPNGDGHPVLVLPGWLASDRSTRALRWFLRQRGYYAHGWKLGLNLGPSEETRSGLGRRLLELSERHGRSVSLIGWSLGGIYARELARRSPASVRQVITLASPFRDPSATAVTRFLRSITPQPASGPPRREVYQQTPPPVPCTNFYSKSDGIVAWQSCLDDVGPQSENVEVVSSHCGMGHHPEVLLAIAERLAQPEGGWRPRVRAPARWPFGVLAGA